MTDALARVSHRIPIVEDILASGVSRSVAVQQIRQQFGLSRRMATRYINAVLLKWEAESDGETRQQKRAQMRQILSRVYRKAITRKGVAVTREGAEYYDDPDTRGAVNVLELLCRLDGLLEQPDTGGGMNVTILQHIQTTLMGGSEPEVLDALEAETTDDP